jgi:hypothetical protein
MRVTSRFRLSGRTTIAAGAVAALIVALTTAVGVSGREGNRSQRVAQQQQETFTYPVKIVCSPRFGEPSPALVPGVYLTAVNVHNSGPETARIVKWVTLSVPQGKRSIRSRQISEELPSFRAFDIDCKHMARDFGLRGEKVPGGKGFLVIQSDRQLDVVAVYTAEEVVGRKGGKGVGISEDVEYIEPNITRGGQLPDLTVSISQQNFPVSCPGGQGTCTTTVNFTVTNAGAVDVTGAFDVLIEADPNLSVTRTITVSGGLGAGASQSFSETLGPANNCYDPDCTVRVTVDAGNAITESDEGNNVDEHTVQG